MRTITTEELTEKLNNGEKVIALDAIVITQEEVGFWMVIQPRVVVLFQIPKVMMRINELQLFFIRIYLRHVSEERSVDLVMSEVDTECCLNRFQHHCK